MINKTRSIVTLNIIFFLSLITGCATTAPTTEELLNADYGKEIKQSDAVVIAENFLKRTLKDPYSAIYEWDSVYRGWKKDALIYGAKVKYGYILNGRINAKNSYGGYTGFKMYTFIFYNQNIKAVYVENNSRGIAVIDKIYDIK